VKQSAHGKAIQHQKSGKTIAPKQCRGIHNTKRQTQWKLATQSLESKVWESYHTTTVRLPKAIYLAKEKAYEENFEEVFGVIVGSITSNYWNTYGEFCG
jgi:hypothetical protein